MYIDDINKVTNKTNDKISFRKYCEMVAAYSHEINDNLKKIAKFMITDFSFDDLVIKGVSKSENFINASIEVGSFNGKGYKVIGLGRKGLEDKDYYGPSVLRQDIINNPCPIEIDHASLKEILDLCEENYHYFTCPYRTEINDDVKNSIFWIYHTLPGFIMITGISVIYESFRGYPEGIDAKIGIDMEKGIPIYNTFELDERKKYLSEEDKNIWLDEVFIDRDKLPLFVTYYLDKTLTEEKTKKLK